MRVLLLVTDLKKKLRFESLLMSSKIPFTVANTWHEAIELLKKEQFDVALFSLTRDTLQIALRSRQAAKIKTPLIAISSEIEDEYIVKAYDTGVDHYVVEPYSFPVLHAQMRSLINRSNGQTTNLLAWHELSIDVEKTQLSISDQRVHLTKGQYFVLEHMMRYPQQITSRPQLAKIAYPGKSDVDDRNVDSLIKKLRKVISEYTGGKDYIKSHWGLGYSMADEPQVRQRRKRATAE